MKLIVTASNDTIFSLLDKAIDGIILPIKNHAMRFGETFDLNDLASYIKQAHQKNKQLFVAVNAIYHEDKLDDLAETMMTLSTLAIDGIYFADLAVYEFAQSYGLKDKLIYYPETYVTNYQDMAFWASEQIKSAVLSREMTLEDIEAISKNSPLSVSIIGHGYLNMFHSKRRLIKTFFDYTKHKQKTDLTNQTYKIIEEIRDEAYPIYQDQFGTHIFREKPLASIRVFESLTPYVDNFIIDTQFYQNDVIYDIIDDYVALKAGHSIDASKYDDHDDGFYYKKTVYKQGGGAV